MYVMMVSGDGRLADLPNRRQNLLNLLIWVVLLRQVPGRYARAWRSRAWLSSFLNSASLSSGTVMNAP